MGPGEPEKKEKKKKSTRPVINYIETNIYTNKQKKKKSLARSQEKKEPFQDSFPSWTPAK